MSTMGEMSEMSEMSVGRYADELRDRLREHPPHAGFTLVDVRAVEAVEADGEPLVEVAFRWHRDVEVYAIRRSPTWFAYMGLEPGVVASEDEIREIWVSEMSIWLTEELTTGYMARGIRHRESDLVVVEQPRDDGEPGRSSLSVHSVRQWVPGPVATRDLPPALRRRVRWEGVTARLRGRSEFSVGWMGDADADVLDRPGDGTRDGAHLEGAGLDAARVRALRDRVSPRLLAWVWAGDGTGEVTEDATPFGHCAVVATDDPDVAEVAVLELLPEAPARCRDALLRLAARTAAERGGARTLVVPSAGGGPPERLGTALC